MDVISLKAFSTILVAVAFVGICWWAFAPSRKKRFEEAANLPFAEDEKSEHSDKAPKGRKEKSDPSKV